MSFATLGSQIIDWRIKQPGRIRRVLRVQLRRGTAAPVAYCVKCTRPMVSFGTLPTGLPRIGCTFCKVALSTYRSKPVRIDQLTRSRAIQLFKDGMGLRAVQREVGIRSAETAVRLKREALAA